MHTLCPLSKHASNTHQNSRVGRLEMSFMKRLHLPHLLKGFPAKTKFWMQKYMWPLHCPKIHVAITLSTNTCAITLPKNTCAITLSKNTCGHYIAQKYMWPHCPKIHVATTHPFSGPWLQRRCTFKGDYEVKSLSHPQGHKAHTRITKKMRKFVLQWERLKASWYRYCHSA